MLAAPLTPALTNRIKASAVRDSSDAVKASRQSLIRDSVLYNPNLDPFFLTLVFLAFFKPMKCK